MLSVDCLLMVSRVDGLQLKWFGIFTIDFDKSLYHLFSNQHAAFLVFKPVFYSWVIFNIVSRDDIGPGG